MKPIRAPLYLALALLTQCSSCKDSDPAPKPLPTLPPETQTGARTFGCLVNGVPFVASGINRVRGELTSINRWVLSAGALSQSEKFNMYILITDTLTFTPKAYLLRPVSATNPPSRLPGFTASANTTQCEYLGTRIRQGNLMLTRYDPVARIASGRFAFTLYEPGGCDTLRVTEGRFDVKF